MNFFYNATADLHVSVKALILLVFAALGLWVGWSIIKLILNLFGISLKKEKQQKNIEA